jgi:serine/threonine protein kinase
MNPQSRPQPTSSRSQEAARESGVPGFPADASGALLLGRFELQNTVLVDSFGEVKSAIDRKTNKEVSLRALTRPELAQAARQQLKALADFSHANVVREYGVMSAAGAGPVVLVQGPLHGHHLLDFVAKHVQSAKPISLRGSYNVVAHVCNALGAIHARGPHASVRPTSVWVHDDGKVQLADLVLSRAALATGDALRVSPAEAAFLAPELKAGQAPTTQSDIFGLGALLYVLLTGRSPMDAFVLPSQVHPEGTPAIDAELIRALSPDPAARHPSPDAFRAALLAFMGSSAQPSADDFGIDIEVEVNLASLVPGARAGAPVAGAPQAARLPR